MKYTYENSDDFTTFPIGGLLLLKNHKDYIDVLMKNPALPPIHPMALLHGE